MSKTYSIQAEFTVVRSLTVDADSQEEALEKFRDYNWDTEQDLDCSLADLIESTLQADD